MFQGKDRKERGGGGGGEGMFVDLVVPR